MTDSESGSHRQPVALVTIRDYRVPYCGYYMTTPAYGADSTLLTLTLLRPTAVAHKNRFRMYVYPVFLPQVCDALVADDLLSKRLRTL
jgi:hypothetical protein